jgi:hypothetical protein
MENSLQGKYLPEAAVLYLGKVSRFQKGINKTGKASSYYTLDNP